MELTRCFRCMEIIPQYPCPHCGYDPAQHPPQSFALRPGFVLGGKYVVGAVLGQGGFAITYMGWDLASERKVTIREYYPAGQVSRNAAYGRDVEWYPSEQARFARSSGMESFEREAREMACVADVPQVVNVQNVFRENGTAYVVMDYVEGETLKRLVTRTGPLTWEQAKGIFLPAARAMARVHDRGMIHRDLNPDNLILEPDGTVRILVEPGAAKFGTGASGMRTVKGGFSPLEQYSQRDDTGPWTDVYALAATMYYTLTGVLPPDAVDRVSADKLRWDLPQLAALPQNVREALRKAMAVQPAKRPQSMTEFTGQLIEQPGGALQVTTLRKLLIPIVTAAVVFAVVAAVLVSGALKKTGGTELSAVSSEPVVTVPSTPATNVPTVTLPETVPVTLPGMIPTTMPETVPTTAPETTPTTVETTEAPARQSFPMCATESLDPEEREQWPSQTFWGQKKYKRSYVTRVVFYDSMQDAGSSGWDISQNHDGTVRAWMDGSILCVAADGLICLDQDASCLFAGFSNVRQIEFNNAVDTSRVENMRYMFADCENLSSLDLSSFDTSRVMDMSHMFSTCQRLTALDLSSFDTSWVEDMESMFYDCKKLTSVNLDSFDTSSVRTMEKMFAYCEKLPTVDVSHFDTRCVTNMSHMFRNCTKLQRVDVSGFDTSNVGAINSMFYKCESLSYVDLNGFDFSQMYGLCFVLQGCPLITNIDADGWNIAPFAQYDGFMDDGDTINGMPWAKYFRG